jgi:hypothetical protein
VSLACALFLWAILGAIAVGVATIGVAIVLASAARRSTFGLIVGGVIGAGGTAVAIGAALFIAGWLFWGMWPHETTSRSAFNDAFGVPAGAEVTQIRSRTMSSTDSHEQFLRFHAPPATIAAITGTRLERTTVEDCRSQSRSWKDDAPDWWNPTTAPRAECYTADPYDKRLVSNAAWLLYDPATGAAHFHYQGVE